MSQTADLASSVEKPAAPTTPLAKELRFALSLSRPSAEEIKAREVLLGPQYKKHTLVLDIDNTLVYTKPVISPATGRPVSMEILIRPYVAELLESVSQWYEIVLFTAGSEIYAEKIRQCLDPSGEKIACTLGNSSCFLTQEGIHVKDLRIFGDRDQKNLVMVDDRITSFAFQIYNGIPVIPFCGDENDNELSFLIVYLEGLKEYDDVREANKKKLYDELI